MAVRTRRRRYPPSIWGGGTPPAALATGATAGVPGTWTPPGSTPPATVAALQGSEIEAIPSTAWTAGQFVQTATAGPTGRATWTGAAWVGGVAPGTTETPPADEPPAGAKAKK